MTIGKLKSLKSNNKLLQYNNLFNWGELKNSPQYIKFVLMLIFYEIIYNYKMKKFKNSSLYILLFPAFFMMALIIFFPIAFTFYISFFRWGGEGFKMNFTGFQNYIDMFRDTRFLNALVNNIFWVILYLIIPVIGGFLLALLLNSNLKGLTVFKTIFYLPGVISFVVVGVIFRLIYDPSHGLVNEILKFLHLAFLARPWLGSRFVGLLSLIIASSWQYIGFCMILFLAGMQSLPLEVFEASEIDGANFYQKVVHIMIPLLKPVSIVVIMITLINSIRVFDLIYIMTKGGPLQATETIGFLMYEKAFRQHVYGEGAAYGIFIFLLVTIPSIIYVRNMLKTEEEY